MALFTSIGRVGQGGPVLGRVGDVSCGGKEISRALVQALRVQEILVLEAWSYNRKGRGH